MRMDFTSPLIFTRAYGGRLQIASEVATAMRRFVQDQSEKSEAGGVLLGRHLAETSDIVVDEVTIPMRGDRRRRCRFFRARRQHQNAIDEAWERSGGTCTYLGEWHTHPEHSPTPSIVDWASWQKKLLFDRHSGVLFFVILGTDEIRAWEGHTGFRPPIRLRPVEIERQTDISGEISLPPASRIARCDRSGSARSPRGPCAGRSSTDVSK